MIMFYTHKHTNHQCESIYTGNNNGSDIFQFSGYRLVRMIFEWNSFLTICRIILLLYLNTLIFVDQSRSNGQTRYANLYGTEPFTSTPTENILGTSLGAAKFLKNFQLRQKEAQPDVTPEPNSRYDFIVVGAGTAGATIASRISEIPNVRVLLIEAGAEETLDMDIPLTAGSLASRSDINWNYTTEPSDEYCRGMIEQRCRWTRGRVMGGSSTINGMVATRGNKYDYDRWAEYGNDGWAYKDVLKYFKKLENIQIDELRGDKKYHGTNGPLTIEYAAFWSPLLESFLKAAQEMGYPLRDYNGEKQIGFSRIQGSTHRGYRMSSNRAFLSGKRRENLHVTKRSMVHKILIDKKKKQATGVLMKKGDQMISVNANKEVILCAGAIGSPQILMLSGIGPAEHLQQLGIDVVKDASVGNNLIDHVAYGGLTFILREPVSADLLDISDASQPYARDFLLFNKGPYAVGGGCNGIGYIDTANPHNIDGIPDMELLSLVSGYYSSPVTMNIYGMNEEIRNLSSCLVAKHTWTGMPFLLRPKSRGWLRLKAKDVNVKPTIVPNYMSDPYDIGVLIKGIRAIFQITKTKAMQDLGITFYNKTVSECKQYPFDSDDYWECNVRSQTTSGLHFCGTCKMGPASDDTAVVDPTLKVYGVKGLRVADASIMPEVPSAHTNIPTYMIAEKLADMVKAEWGYPTGDYL